MSHKVGIYYNESGLREIMKGEKIEKMEEQIMAQKLSQIEAEFLQHFGFEGKFELKAVTTNSRRSRVTFRVASASSRTTAALKREPGWLGKFLSAP